ncbi:hypothetical protein JX266_001249 [Neoarthrinium moseri]|nr:hypothetical protein JX266_001249 [Neoarthrinium moseri]
MLFAEGDAPHLRAWIIKRLANTTDADADVLADYVLALLRHDGDIESIRGVFEEEIPDFMREDAAAFTDDVFQAVKYKSYVPGAPPAPPVARQPPLGPPQAPHIPLGPAAQQQPYVPPFNVQHTPYAETPTGFSSQTFRNGSKKRSYRDLDAPDSQPFSSDLYGGAPYQQPYKQARRGGAFNPRGSRFDEPYGSGGRGGHPASNGFAAPSGPSPGYPSQPPFPMSQQSLDANSILENIQRLQELGAQMGIQMPQTGPLPQPLYSGPALIPASSHRRKGPCRDYETKGYCSRGNRCQYEHGNGSVYVPSFVAPPAADEYDPNNAAMGMLEHPGQPIKPQDKALHGWPPNRREPKKPKRKGGRSSVSAEGPSHDKTNTKLVLENIPEENFTEDAVREFFAQFGTISDVSLRSIPGSQKRIAIINFDSWAAANAAWKSPKVVFDNRFVKLYWFKDESKFASDGQRINGVRNDTNGDKASNEPEFDMEEFQRKQEEAQKIHLEKQQKREELERQRQELEEKRKELIARQLEEKRKLQAKLAENGVKEDSLSPVLTKATPDEGGVSQAEALRAKLAALEEEADSLGIDPDATGDEVPFWASRGRGRGRRPYRGRGSFPPRAYRGGYGYRGRGGATQDVHAAYAAYSLDNRPKVIAITGVDFTESSKDEALRQHLFGVGEFTDISTDSGATQITFKDRKTAEKFMFGVSANKTIPGVDGTVELTWANSAPRTAGADSDFPMSSGLEDEQAAKTANDVEETNAFGRPDRDQGDMDYEGGDWDIS